MRSLLLPTVLALALCATSPGAAFGQDASALTGRWVLNRASTRVARDVGFGTGLPAGAAADSRGSETTPLSIPRPESADDARRASVLTEEVRTPASRLAIADTPTAVTITDEAGRSRTFHPTGREETIEVADLPVPVVARREAGQLVVVYQVQRNRQLRYTYSHGASSPRLIIEVQFLERGAKDSATLVYDPAPAGEPAAPPSAGAPPGAEPLKLPPGLGPARSQPPAAGAPAGQDRYELPTMPQRPGDEFKGLTALSVVVEDMGTLAASCGLKQQAIEAAAAKSLADAGLKVLKNSDEGTYLYINVNTSKVSSGFCVSRYDVTLYTYATATMPYGTRPVQVQVSLLRDGGMAGGDPTANAQAVLRAVKQAADQCAARIRDANR